MSYSPLEQFYYLMGVLRQQDKKKLSQRLHNCQFCGHIENRDISRAKIIEHRGKFAVGLPVI